MSESAENNDEVRLPLKKGRILHSSRRQSIIFSKMVNDAFGGKRRDVRLFLDQVGCRYAGEEGISVLELPNGEKLYVDLTLNRLEEKLTKLDDEIDLSDVTQNVIEKWQRQQRKLNRVFNAEAAIKALPGDDMIIVLYGDTADDFSFKKVPLVILRSELEKLFKDFISLTDWKNYRSDWGMGNLAYGPYVEITKKRFEEALASARAEDKRVLDLRQETKGSLNTLHDFDFKTTEQSKWLLDFKRNP